MPLYVWLFSFRVERWVVRRVNVSVGLWSELLHGIVLLTQASKERILTMRLATFSKGIAETLYLLELLQANELVLKPSAFQARKPNTRRAIKFAQRHDIPYVSIEDGFVRSVGLGRAGEPGVSLTVDQTGIYYDSTRPSYLEELLNDKDDIFTPSLMQTAQQAIAFILKHKISKYNGAPDMPRDQCSGSGLNL